MRICKINNISTEFLDDISEIKALSSTLNDGNITDGDVRSSINRSLKTKIEKFVKKYHLYKISYDEKRPYYWTKVRVSSSGKKKNITARTLDSLYEKIYQFYAGEQESIVLSDLIFKTLMYFKGTVEDKTLAIYLGLWNKYYANNKIAKFKITNITYDMWFDFFYDTIKDNRLTRKQSSQILIVLNKIYEYCIRKKILHTNPVQGILKNAFPFKKEAPYNHIKAEGLTPEQVEKVEEWCVLQLNKKKTKKVYPLAIQLNLRVGLRVGELRALTWNDIDFSRGCINVHSQVVNNYETDDANTFRYSGTKHIDHLKSYENARLIPLTADTMDILRTVRDYKFDDEYVFPIRYNTFNDKIKVAAKYAGVNNLDQIRPHTTRVTAATMLYRKSNSVKAVQTLLGHTKPSMTDKYIKGLDSYDLLKDLI